MSVISCTLQHTGRKHAIRDDLLGRSNRLQYHVRTDDPTDDGWAVYTGMQVAGPDPAPGWMANYITSGGYVDVSNYARGFDFDQTRPNSPTFWVVTVDFVPLPPGVDPTYTASPLDPTYNPLLEPPRYWVDQRTVTRIIEEDRDGRAIVNSARQVFDEPVEEEVELDVINVVWNVATVAELRTLNRTYRNKLNAAAYLGYPAEHLLCLPIRSGKSEVLNGVRFYRATAKILASDKPWRREFVNRGFKHLADDGGTDKLVIATDPIVDASGNPTAQRSAVSEPVNLVYGPYDATAEVVGAVASGDPLAVITDFTPVRHAADKTPLVTPTTALNVNELTLADGAAVQLTRFGSAWEIVKSPPDSPMPAALPNGYRLPEGKIGSVVKFATKTTADFSSLPFNAALPA